MDERITLDYGSGGLKTSELIESLLLPALDNPALAQLGDGAVLQGADTLVFSTDSFVVSPAFPGGDIGNFLSAARSTIFVWREELQNI